MEVRRGYKQTAVGAIPEDWEVDSIANLASITTGDKNTQDRVDDGAYPFFVRSSTIERINSYSFDGEGVLTAGDGVGTGKIFHYIKGKFDLHQRVYLISDFSLRLEAYFFFLYFSNNFYSRIMQMTAKSSVDSVRREMIADMRIPLPSPGEQRAIAAALYDVDALLAKLDQLIAKKRDLKQAAMQQLLTGQTRLLGFSEEWELRALGEIATANKGNQLSGSLMTRHGRFAHLNGGISPSGYTDKSNVPGDTIAISEGGNSCGYVQFMSEPYWCGGHCYSVIPNGVDNRFLYHALKGEEPSIMGLRVGSGLPNVQKTALLAFNLRCPKVSEEQTAIAAILSDMDAEIAVLGTKLVKARALKQGMMQELLTGRIRLVQREAKREDAKPIHNESRKVANDSRSWAFNEAVIISVIAKNFADARHPLGRMRYTKLSYLLHRYAKDDTEGYLKKAAGPYNPATRYKGPEAIAQTSGYLKRARSGELNGFAAGEHVDKACAYFDKRYGPTALEWLTQFRYEKNEALELLTTVDKAVEELRSAGKEVTVQSVNEVLLAEPEWKPKLERPVFSDERIQATILMCQRLFGAG